MPWLDHIMMLISSEKAWLACGLLFLGVCFFQKNARLNQIMWVAGASIAVTDLVCFRLIKPLLHRLRPCYQMEMVRLLEPSCGSDFGLPSNHAANSMAFVIVVLCLTRSWKWAWLLLLPLVVGVSRLYVGVHFPIDVLVGFTVGCVTGLSISLIYVWKQAEILRVINRVRKERI